MLKYLVALMVWAFVAATIGYLFNAPVLSFVLGAGGGWVLGYTWGKKLYEY